MASRLYINQHDSIRLFDRYIDVGIHPVAVQVFDDVADDIIAGRPIENFISPERFAEGQRAALLIGLIHQLTIAIEIVPALKHSKLVANLRQDFSW